jgi:hypothetical protein
VRIPFWFGRKEQKCLFSKAQQEWAAHYFQNCLLMAQMRRDNMTLPTESKKRKEYPVTSGLLDYFPDACAEVAHVSFKGNEQHNPGQPMHWAREKSSDHEDCIARHTLERGKTDTDGLRHTAKRAWRALAALQLEIEAAEQKDEVHNGDFSSLLYDQERRETTARFDTGSPYRYRCRNFRCTAEFLTPRSLALHYELHPDH